MTRFAKKISISPQSLRRSSLEALACLQPVLLLRMLIAASQSLKGRIAQPEALARSLLLDGQQRLRDLLDAAPRLNLPLDRVIDIIRSDNTDDLTPEEDALQALIEMCLALMLRWLEKNKKHPSPLFALKQSRPFLLSPAASPSTLPPYRTRACPTTPAA
jgi:hypothetical protein